MDRFPPLKSQEEIFEEARRRHAAQRRADFLHFKRKFLTEGTFWLGLTILLGLLFQG